MAPFPTVSSSAVAASTFTEYRNLWGKGQRITTKESTLLPEILSIFLLSHMLQTVGRADDLLAPWLQRHPGFLCFVL